MRIHYLQHVPFEGLARIQTWAEIKRHTVTSTRLFAGEALPSLEEVDFLIIMGGPMGVHDDFKYPWLKKEKVFIESFMAKQKKVLGICLGAQLIAQILGAKVYPNAYKEIGWFPIELNPPNVRYMALHVLSQRMMVFHWHGDTFDLPQGALHLARSRACENQAFALGKHVIGLQFHLEVAQPQMEALVLNGQGDLSEGPYVQEPREMFDLSSRFVPPLHAALDRFLDVFAAP